VPIYFQAFPDTHCAYPPYPQRDGQVEFTCLDRYWASLLGWRMEIHLIIRWTQHRACLIVLNMLTLSQAILSLILSYINRKNLPNYSLRFSKHFITQLMQSPTVTHSKCTHNNVMQAWKGPTNWAFILWNLLDTFLDHVQVDRLIHMYTLLWSYNKHVRSVLRLHKH